MKLRTTLLLLLLAICAIGPAFAQDASGKITGTVHDPQGAVIPGAKIVVTNVATGISTQATTDADGIYQVLHLPIGNYRVSAEQAGFQKVFTAPSKLEINATLKIDVTLPVGSASESVEVTSAAAMVETQNATMGNSVTERPIINLPLNGRDVLDLAKLEPGVTEQNPGNGSAGSFSIAGSRTDAVTFLLDGGINNSLLDNGVVFNPNPDTIAEFRILESNFSAEYGRNAGGIISVVTKSGTKDFHGSAFEFLRNDALDANEFFRKAGCNPSGTSEEQMLCKTPVLKRNQFGGTFGGPLNFLGKNKSFFFVGYQGQRQTKQLSYVVNNAFTDAQIRGDFSQTPDAITPSDPEDPNDHGPVPNFLLANPYFQPDPAKALQGIIDPSRINPIVQKYIELGIVPHSPTGSLVTSANEVDNNDEFTGKLDFNLTDRDHLSTTLGFTRAPYLDPYPNGATMPAATQSNAHKYFANIAYTKTITPNLLNEFRLTAQRLNDSQWNPVKELPTYKELGVNVPSDLPTGPPVLYFDTGLFLGYGYRGPVDKVNNTFDFTDTLSWVKGKHTIKAGFTYSPYQNNTVYAYEVNGEYDFYGYGSTYNYTLNDKGYSYADFILGSPDEFIQYGNAPSNIRTKSYYGFVQDEWRVKPNLTLSFGMRYEYNSPKRDTMGRSFSFKWGAQSERFVNAPVGLLFPGDPGAPDGANFPDRNNFAPRFGFAWDPQGKGKTSIRGGFGLFYNVLTAEDNLQFNGQAPFFGYSDFYIDPWDANAESTIMVDPYGTAGVNNPFPSQTPTKDVDFAERGFLPFAGPSVYFVDRNLRTPYVYQYNLSVQRELPGSMRAEVAYVGSTAHKLTGIQDINPFIPGTRTRLLNSQPGAWSNTGTNSGFTWQYVDQFRNVGYQNYNSLQASLKKTLTGEGTKLGASYFTLGYTWAKNIDTTSGYRQENGRVKPYDPGADRAVADMDVQNRVTFSGGWDLPFHTLMPALPKALAKGWSLYPIVTWRTGFPIELRGFMSRASTRPGPSGYGDSNLVRPNLVGTSVQTFDPHTNVSSAGAQYFSPSNFNTDYPDAECMDRYGDTWTCSANSKWGVPLSPTYGTLPRNFFRGPGRFNMDFAIAKNTSIGERANLEFRWEMFNMLNSAQFSNPSGSGVDPYSDAFGLITSTAAPRIMQVGLRLSF